jgi:hypothetical protein
MNDIPAENEEGTSLEEYRAIMPVFVKASGKLRILDASQEHELDQEAHDMLGAFGCPSWEGVYKNNIVYLQGGRRFRETPFVPQNGILQLPHLARQHPRRRKLGRAI